MLTLPGLVTIAVGACVGVAAVRRWAAQIGPDAASRPEWDSTCQSQSTTATFKLGDSVVCFQALPWSKLYDCADVMARAHQGGHIYRHIFGCLADPEDASLGSLACATRTRALRWFFARNLALLRSNRQLYVGLTEEEEELDTRCVCFFYLSEPENGSDPDLTLLREFRVGLLAMPWLWGLQSLVRLFAVVRLLEEYERLAVAEAAPRALRSSERIRYLRLERVSVAPELQGFGLGRAMIAHVGECLDATGLPALLMTQNKKTVKLYQEFGWRIIRQDTVSFEGPSTHPWTNFIMWRDVLPQKD